MSLIYVIAASMTRDERRMDEGILHKPGRCYKLAVLKTTCMATANNSILLKHLRGQIGKQIVVKRYGKKIVVTSYPDMSGVKPSPHQKNKRKEFAKAVAYAQAINNDPVQKAQYLKKVKKGQTVYHYAIKEYLAGTTA